MTTHLDGAKKDLKCSSPLPVYTLAVSDICFPVEQSSWESHCFEQNRAPLLCNEKIESYFILPRFRSL